MTAAAVICFQAADIYEVQVFRGQLRQMTRMISSWAFVFLLFIGASFFAKLGGEVSRLWLSAFFFVGLAGADCRTAVPAFDGAQLGARGPARPPHHHRRLGPERRATGRGAQGPGRFGHRYPRRIRRPQRHPRAGDLRRQPETRQGRRHRRVRPPHPRRPRAVRAADFGGDADPRNAEEIVGAAGGHPAFRPHQQAALPPPLLFLSRQGPDARRVRGADHRLGSGDEVAVRPRRRRHHSAAGLAGDGAGRARRKARQSGAGAVPPEALRLQQRAHRRLQVPLAVSPSGRSDRRRRS